MAGRVKEARPAAESARLDPQAWIDAALEILADGGIDAVRIEPLAKQLGVTKGSFYWHFKDRGALLDAMLTQWRRNTTLDIIARLERSAATPEARLAQLLKMPFRGVKADKSAEVELALRLWGRRDPQARAALAEVDQLRLRYFQDLLQRLGFSSEAAAVRAIYCYSFMRVAGTLIDHQDEALIERSVALLVQEASREPALSG